MRERRARPGAGLARLTGKTGSSHTPPQRTRPSLSLVYAAALLASTFASTFFTGAVAGVAMTRADGQDPDVPQRHPVSGQVPG